MGARLGEQTLHETEVSRCECWEVVWVFAKIGHKFEHIPCDFVVQLLIKIQAPFLEFTDFLEHFFRVDWLSWVHFTNKLKKFQAEYVGITNEFSLVLIVFAQLNLGTWPGNMTECTQLIHVVVDHMLTPWIHLTWAQNIVQNFNQILEIERRFDYLSIGNNFFLDQNLNYIILTKLKLSNLYFQGITQAIVI